MSYSLNEEYVELPPKPSSSTSSNECITLPPPVISSPEKPVQKEYHVQDIRELLGQDVVLLPVPSGTKFPSYDGWTQVTVDKMEDHNYIAKFTGNIGVLLGAPSGHLCTVDVDSDADFNAFKTLNPQLINTLQTSGARGGNLWFRVTGPYPKLCKIKKNNGASWGEFRADGGQTIIHGTHPNGNKYEMLNTASPISIEFDSLIWPVDLTLPWLKTPPPTNVAPTTSDDSGEIVLDAHTYVQKMPAAISGSDGHGQTFAVACALVKGFDLTPEQSLPILQEYNKRCLPPWTPKELQHKLDSANAGRDDKPRGYLKLIRASGGDLASLPNDTGRAARFVDAFGQDIRFVHEWETWLIWDGHHWRRDRDGAIMRLVKELCLREFQKALSDNPSNPKLASEARKEAAELGDAAQVTRMLKMAESDSRVIVHPEDLNADPYLVGVENGVIELRTGNFRAGRREDYIIAVLGTHYDANTTCPRFERFLNEIFQGDQELVTFARRAIGYSLTGDVSEQGFFFLHGCGANGKSRLTETILALMGGYGLTTAPEIVALTNRDTPMHHLAELHGARFVTLPETEEAHRLAESRLKSLTGGDEITACRKYEHPFRFKPQLKLWIHGNHKPEIRGMDNGIWRRVRMVPFDATFPPETRDVALQQKLLAELPGILNLAISGCLDWQQNGLLTPATVRCAVDNYRTEQDVLAEFLEDNTERVAGSRVPKAQLYGRYTQWAEAQGIQKPWSTKAIAKNLRERGITEEKHDGVRHWRGLRLLI